MTTKTIDELQIGDVVADMHYGIDQLRERFTVVHHMAWNEPGRDDVTGTRNRPPHFADYLTAFATGIGYTNKHLIVMDQRYDYRSPTGKFEDEPSTEDALVLTCGYNYDGRRAGIVILKRK